MNYREMFKEIIDSFFVIFTISIMGMVVYLHLFGVDTAPLRDIVAVFITSVLTSLAGIVVYSKKELRRLGLIVRYLIHMVLVIGIVLVAASYMGWILWSAPITVIRFMGLIIAVFVTVHAVIFYQTMKLADTLNEKLKERYRQ